MPTEKFNEHVESNESIGTELSDLKNEILKGSKNGVENGFKIPDISDLYEKEGNNTVFHLDKVKEYFDAVYKRLNGMKSQKFGVVSKENNFKGTILAIQIFLNALDSRKGTNKYKFGKINGEYNDETKNAIRQFQTDNNLTWKDGKPGKETIGRMSKELGIILNSKNVEESNEKIRSDVKSIVDGSITPAPLYSLASDTKNEIVNYICEGNLGKNKNLDLESKINEIASILLNWKLKYLVDHSKEPLATNIKKIKEMDNNYRKNFTINEDEKKGDKVENNGKSFCGIKLEPNKPYDVSSFYQFETGKKRIKDNAFQNCQLTKGLGKIGINKTLIVDKNGKEVQKSNYHVETWYSQRVLPGGGLEKWKGLKGRHVAEDGTVRDGDGYIVVAAHKDFAPQDSIVMTTLGPGKVYDTGCAYGRFDIYVDWNKSSKKKKS